MSLNGSTSEQIACACGCGKPVKLGQRWSEPACKARAYRRRQASKSWDEAFKVGDTLEALENEVFELRDKLEALEAAYTRLREEHQDCQREIRSLNTINAVLMLGQGVSRDNPYVVLGVRPDAEPETIEGAYKALAQKYHPDRHPGDPVSARRMQAITAAYDEIRRWRGRR